MEMFQGLLNGFSIALTGVNILFAVLGALLGTAIGVLPGLGPAATRFVVAVTWHGFGSHHPDAGIFGSMAARHRSSSTSPAKQHRW
jgi:hypothetical protein